MYPAVLPLAGTQIGNGMARSPPMWIWCAMYIMSNEVFVADCTVPGLWQVTQNAKSLRPPPCG